VTAQGRGSAATFGASGLPVGDLLRSEPVTVDLDIPAVALAVGAHPDDIEFGCGAALAKWAAAGAVVHYLILTDGSKGSWDPTADLTELVASRQSECRAAASIIGGTTAHGPATDDRVHFIDRVDGELENGPSERREVAKVIRLVRPDVILGHDPWRRYRLHPDHRAAGFITIDAVVAARDHHFFPELGLAPHRPRAVLLFEPDMPNHVEESADYAATKIEALLCHHSQLESTMGIHPGEDHGDAIPGGRSTFALQVRHQMAVHGSLAEVDAAEAFRLISEV
jgi:LmbE family N-acetylglucosaminyl deacetylase